MRTYPAGVITPHGAYQLLHARHPQMYYRSPDNSVTWHLMGARAPVVNIHDGIVLTSLKGLIAPWQIQQQQGATQDGASFTGAVYDPLQVDIGVEAFGATPVRTRKVIRHWIESWDVRRQGELGYVTESGPWWAPTRWAKQPVDQVLGAHHRRQPFTWVGQVDNAFWQSYDSQCTFPESPASGTLQGFLTLSNRGDQIGWHNIVCHGPFDEVAIANGPGSSSMIRFGPLLAGQIALLRTHPRRRGVYDLTPAAVNATGQQLNQWQAFLRGLTTFATNNNVPPFLRQFESLFGILPPQGEMYSLLEGRFTKSIPAKPIAGPPVESRIAIRVTGATTATRIVAYLTPLRRWPL